MNAAPPTEQTDPAAAAGAPGIDLEQLADKVYALLLAEARLGRARFDGFGLRSAEK